MRRAIQPEALGRSGLRWEPDAIRLFGGGRTETKLALSLTRLLTRMESKRIAWTPVVAPTYPDPFERNVLREMPALSGVSAAGGHLPWRHTVLLG